MKRKAGFTVWALVWAIWFVLLFAAPFPVEQSGSLLLLDYSYGYVSAGFLLGLVLFAAISKAIMKQGRLVLRFVFAVLGVLFFFLLVLPEWVFPGSELYAHPLGLEWHKGSEASLSTWDYYLLWAFADSSLGVKISLLLEGLTCGYLGGEIVRFSAVKCAAGLEGEVEEGRGEDDGSASQGGHFLTMFVFAASLLAGLSWVAALVAPLVWREQVSALGFDPALVSGICSAIVVLLVLTAGVIARKAAASVPLSSSLGASLAAFAAGRVFCCVVSSCAFERELLLDLLFPLLIVLFAALAFLLAAAVLAHLGSCEVKADATTARTEGEPLSGLPAIKDLPIFSCLTEREQAVVSLLLEGKTSAQSGGALGLKAATVRTYLQRAYKKLGVSGAAELREKFDEHRAPLLEAEPADAQTVPQVASARKRKTCSSLAARVALFALIVLFVLCYFPFHSASMRGAWYLEHGTVIGTGLGLLLLVLAMVFRSIVGRRTSSHDKTGGVFLLILFSLSTAALLVLRFGWPQIYDALGIGSATLFALLLTAFHVAISAYALLRVGLAGCLFEADRLIPMAALALLAAMLCCFSAVAWSLLVVVAALLVVLSGIAFLLLDGAQSATRKKPDTKIPARLDAFVLPGFFAAVAFGFVIGEQWHGEESAFSFNALVLFSAVSLLACLVALFKEKQLRLAPTLALVLVMTYSAVAIHVVFALFVPLFSITLALVARSSQRDDSFVLVAFGAVGCALGLIGGHGITDAWTSVASLGLEDFSSGTGVQFMMLVAPTVLVLMLFVGLACFVFVINSALTLKKPALSHDVEVRRLLFLRSQGLDKTQARTLLLVAQGETSAQIASELFYSLGMVNTMRAEGYKVLGIHSSQQLRDLLESAVPAGQER